ncbi:MAG: PrsW family glutamic-type intramembrane protease [Candidatus Andersenbacteria bacterium]
MSEIIVLPPGVALAILAFLLSLVPAGLFLWVWYLRRHDRPVPGGAVTVGLIGGGLLVIPAFYLEKLSAGYWELYWPTTAHYFHGAILPLQGFADLFWPAVGTFGVVATVEEGVRFLFLWLWFRRASSVDQVFDGLLIGIAAGLGFATLENSIYFWNLFTEGSFDTLVFVFFLRFMISTLAHISFGGIMGALLAKGVFAMYRPGQFYLQAFFLPWILHGLFDLLLGINLSMYAVLLLVPALILLIVWSTRREYFVINRIGRRLLPAQAAPETREAKLMEHFFKQLESPWNVNAPWLREKRLNSTLLRNLEDNA